MNTKGKKSILKSKLDTLGDCQEPTHSWRFTLSPGYPETSDSQIRAGAGRTICMGATLPLNGEERQMART